MVAQLLPAFSSQEVGVVIHNLDEDLSGFAVYLRSLLRIML